jgi:hypothetical protein
MTQYGRPIQHTTKDTSFSILYRGHCGPSSVVRVATDYGLDGPEIEYRCKARFSAPLHTGPGAHPASCTMSTWSFLGGKCGRGVTLTPHRLLVPLVMKEYSNTSTPHMGRKAYTESQCLHKGALCLNLIEVTNRRAMAGGL